VQVTNENLFEKLEADSTNPETTALVGLELLAKMAEISEVTDADRQLVADLLTTNKMIDEANPFDLSHQSVRMQQLGRRYARQKSEILQRISKPKQEKNRGDI